MIEFVPRPEPATAAGAPKNYKRAEAIEEWITRETERRQEKYDEVVASMALDVDYARVVAIGVGRHEGLSGARGEHTIKVLLSDLPHEAEMIQDFWEEAQRYSRLCGWNILDFDLPIILRRSWALGVTPTRLLDFRRYSTSTTIDLMQILYNWGNSPGPRYRGLKEVAKMYNIQNDFPNLDGSDVATMDEETLIAYCRNDVRMTRELAMRTRGYYWK